MIITFSFNYITLLHMMLADCCMHEVVQHGGRGAMAAAMVLRGWFVCFT
jgi:hypothetical protein